MIYLKPTKWGEVKQEKWDHLSEYKYQFYESGESYSIATTSVRIRAFETDKDFDKRLNENLPDYYRDGEDIKIIQKPLIVALTEFDYILSTVPSSIIPSLVTESTIDKWEQELELITDKTKDLEIRKKIVLLHWYFIYNDTTLEALYESFEIIGISGKVLIEYGLNVTLELNANSNLNVMLENVYRKAIPAHLGLSLVFGDTWQTVENNGSWQVVENGGTWGQFLL